MANIEKNQAPEVLPDDWVKRAKKLSTTLISDVMDIPVEMNHLIKPFNIDNVLVGSAVTIEVEDGDNLAVHHAIYHSEPGHVLVVSANGYEKRAIIGELMVAAADALQLNGFIIDGLIRDVQTLSTTSFPVFGRGVIPAGPTKNGPGVINQPINCGGLKVEPGDFVMGDADGVIVLQRANVEKALQLAEEKAKYEKARLESIADGNIKPKWLE